MEWNLFSSLGESRENGFHGSANQRVGISGSKEVPKLVEKAGPFGAPFRPKVNARLEIGRGEGTKAASEKIRESREKGEEVGKLGFSQNCKLDADPDE